MDSKQRMPPEGGLLQKLGLSIRLVARLIIDKEVPLLVKLFPLAAFLYLLLPDLMVSVFDDLIVLGVCLYLFIELSPDSVIQKHIDELHENLLTSYRIDAESYSQKNRQDRK